MSTWGGHGLRAFGMLVMAAAVLGGIGWGVDALVRRLDIERRALAPPPAPVPPAAPQPAAAPPEDAVERQLRETLAEARASARRSVEEGPARPAGDEVTAPLAIQSPAPKYTESARRARIQGVVILEVEIDREGRVTSTRILKGLPLGLDEEARQAISQWRFQPAMRNGEPVPAITVLTVNFQLQ